jgi:hypothetical protein
LVAPEYDDNPWNYKFTWNPRNVILAGQATATYLENKQVKFIPPNRIFSQTVDVMVPELGKFESYANRDSLGYISPYGIDSAHTVLRGTLRRKNYCQNWNYLVNLGLTDDTYKITNSENMTYRDLMAAFLTGANQQNLEIQLSRFMNKAQNSKEFQRIKWLGLLNDEKIGHVNFSQYSSRTMPRKEDSLLQEIISDIINKPINYNIVDVNITRPNHDREYGLDDEKLRGLGFRYPVEFYESLRSTVLDIYDSYAEGMK